MPPRDFRLDDCRVIRTSPVHYDQCVVEVETDDDLLFILSDENLSEEWLVELPGEGEDILRRIPLQDLRALLDAAEKKLLTGE